MSVQNYIDMMPILEEGMKQGSTLKYKRLCDAIAQGISSGAIGGGRKLPPHRILADKLKVTTGTVCRAYEELERMGLVIAQVGSGTYVRDKSTAGYRERGFRNAVDREQKLFDMSRNMPISSVADQLLENSLLAISKNCDLQDDIAGYASEAGLLHHRHTGATWLAQAEFTPSTDQVICTNGAQHGLLCSLMTLIGQGEVIATEKLTYPGLISATRMLRIRLIGIELDDQGMVPASLDSACRSNRISAIFITPTLQSPTTVTMSIQRRQEIVQVCRENNLIIIEDDTHGVLMGSRPPPLSTFAPERTVLLTSLSKVLAPGLRVGYLHAPDSLISKLSAAVRSTCWMASPLCHQVATELIESHSIESLVEKQTLEISRRKTLVLDYLNGLSFASHGNSPHFWIQVPDPLRAFHIEAQMRDSGYLVATGEAFAVGHSEIPQFIRASVCDTTSGDKTMVDAFEKLRYALFNS